MPAGIIDKHMPLLGQLAHAGGSAGRLLASPLTMPLAEPFTQLCEQDFPAVRVKEAALCLDVARCAGSAWFASSALGDVIDKIEKGVLTAVKRNRKHEWYVVFFGKKKGYQIRRLSLSSKLELLATWLEPMQKVPFAGVAALLPELQQQLAAAKAAEEARTASEDRLAQFRTIGEGAQFTARLNEVRKVTLGELAAMPHKLPGEGLPMSFADAYFAPVRKRKAEAEPTEEQLEEQIEQKAQEMADLQQQLTDMRAQKEADASVEAQDAAEAAALVAAKKEIAAAKAKAKKIAADLAKRQKKQRRKK